jgi:malonate-semialdehyde dehydrogenase (acetylating)/methylmalonate-semialdehyde dehydrogenase
MFAWSGNKGSVLGPSSLYGKGGIDFWTQYKTTTALWRADDAITSAASMVMPTNR